MKREKGGAKLTAVNTFIFVNAFFNGLLPIVFYTHTQAQLDEPLNFELRHASIGPI